MSVFLRDFDVGEHTRILDVGGTAGTWSSAVVPKATIVLLNTLRAATESFAPGFHCVEGDGCLLPFRDKSFDIVFSNSVIEHVGPADAQARFASEVARVGKGYWVQTPNRYFPVETHLLTPLVHWLPKHWSAWLIRRFTLWAFIHRPNEGDKIWYIEHFLNDIRLCTCGDLRSWFPGAAVRKERFLLLTKSLIAVKKNG